MFRGDEGRRQKAEGRRQKSPHLRLRFSFCLLLSAFCLLPSAGCRQKMANQPRYDPLESSDFFADGMAARPRVAGTVARGELNTLPEVADGYPITISRAVLDRGEQRFNIYCTPCHGRLGDGQGMIPSRGYRHPPSFHTATLRAQPTGHYYDVMTNGFGSMPSYRTMIPPTDRWAIIAYIRALQLSQNGTLADVPPDARAKMMGETH
jgi:mono/diheme cytochrome c family protein